MSNSPLPSFATPPVIEVVSGVLFDPLPALTGPLVGRFWSEHLAGFHGPPTEAPSLPPQIELHGQFPPGAQFMTDPPPGPRFWFVSDEQDRVVQVQKDRLLCNWRKTEARHAYPRFASVYSFFSDQLGLFGSFVSKRLAVELVPRQYELTYVNHVPDGVPAAVGDVLPDVAWRRTPGRWLGAPENVEAEWAFLLPNELGRLRVRAQTALLARGNKPVLILELTARGFAENRDEWFRTAHEWIVRGFADLISDSTAAGWGKA